MSVNHITLAVRIFPPVSQTVYYIVVINTQSLFIRVYSQINKPRVQLTHRQVKLTVVLYLESLYQPNPLTTELL